MAVKTIRVRPVRGTTKANDLYIGPYGSISVDTEKKQLRIHDGITPGGTVVGGSGAPSQAQESLIQAFDKLGSFPALGVKGVLYVAIDTATGYRWSDGGSYIAIAPKPESTDELKEGTEHLYFTTERARSAFKTNDGILLDQDGTIKARIASDDSIRKGEEKGEFVTPKVLLDWLKSSGFTQDANGNLLLPGTKAPEPEKEVPVTPETKPTEGDQVDANGISTYDTTNNKGTLARYAARINSNFLTARTTTGTEYQRMKYSNEGSTTFTFGKALINEDAPYAIINMDNLEFAVGVYDWPGLDPHVHQMKLVTLNNQSNVISMIKRSNLDSGQFAFPVSLGYVDQPETMSASDINAKYKMTLSIVGKSGGPGVQYISGAGLGGGGLVMRMSIDGKLTGKEFSAKYVKGQGYPCQRNLTMDLKPAEAAVAFPNNEIYNTNTGSAYVQVSGEFIVTMTMTNTETNETKELSFPLTANRYDS